MAIVFPKYIVDKNALVKFKIKVDWSSFNKKFDSDFIVYLDENSDLIEVEPPQLEDIFVKDNIDSFGEYGFLVYHKKDWDGCITELLEEKKHEDFEDKFIIELCKHGYLDIVPLTDIEEAYLRPNENFYNMVSFVVNLFVEDIIKSIQTFPTVIQKMVIEETLLDNCNNNYMDSKMSTLFNNYLNTK